MTRYPTAFRPAAFALGAVALTALTFGLAVVMPAHYDSRAAERGDAALAARAPASIEVEIVPARIDVRGVRADANVSAPALGDGTARG
jgi:hypothetical protein